MATRRSATTRDAAALWSAARSLASDRYSIEVLEMPSPVLMERAALCVATEVVSLIEAWPAPIRGVFVVCGPGNNGGDGVAVARILAARGLGLRVAGRVVTTRHNASVAAQLRRASTQGVIVTTAGADADGSAGLGAPLDAEWLIVDGLLGTGSKGAPRGAVADAVEWINRCAGPRVAIDLPTGVDPDRGRVAGLAARVDRTVSFQRSKPGLHITPGRAFAGEVVIADIGLVDRGPQAEQFPLGVRAAALIDPGAVAAVVRGLKPGRHKGERGHVAIVGGSAGTPGAAVLAGAAALRAGAGLVTVVSREPEVQSQLLATRPELMVRAPEGEVMHAGAGALVVGPGLTQRAPSVFARLFRGDTRPAIWDASALDDVPAQTDSDLAGPRIMTPHPGEAARLLTRLTAQEWSAKDVQADRFAAVVEIARRTGAVVVLKGEGTLVSDGQRVAICVSGGPGLATAGSGDCLAGIIGALLARGARAWEAACAGVHLHGLAGERAIVAKPGPVALDIADAAGEVVAELGPGAVVPSKVASSGVDRARDVGSDHARWPRVRHG